MMANDNSRLETTVSALDVAIGVTAVAGMATIMTVSMPAQAETADDAAVASCIDSAQQELTTDCFVTLQNADLPIKHALSDDLELMQGVTITMAEAAWQDAAKRPALHKTKVIDTLTTILADADRPLDDQYHALKLMEGMADYEVLRASAKGTTVTGGLNNEKTRTALIAYSTSDRPPMLRYSALGTVGKVASHETDVAGFLVERSLSKVTDAERAIITQYLTLDNKVAVGTLMGKMNSPGAKKLAGDSIQIASMATLEQMYKIKTDSASKLSGPAKATALQQYEPFRAQFQTALVTLVNNSSESSSVRVSAADTLEHVAVVDVDFNSSLYGVLYDQSEPEPVREGVATALFKLSPESEHVKGVLKETGFGKLYSPLVQESPW